jgi:hypothetical protein
VTETRAVSGISGVSVNGVGLLLIEQTGSESLTVTAAENILPLVTTEIVGDLLILGIQPNTQINTTQGIVYRLTVRQLDRITLSGATQAEALPSRGPRAMTRRRFRAGSPPSISPAPARRWCG